VIDSPRGIIRGQSEALGKKGEGYKGLWTVVMTRRKEMKVKKEKINLTTNFAECRDLMKTSFS